MIKKIEVYTRPGCSYCVSAKRLLTNEGLDFIEHDTAGQPDKLSDLMKKSRLRTFLQIFIDDQLIGGFDDLVEYKQTQSLLN